MHYDLSKLPLRSLLGPLSAASAALARLDERIARSVVGPGWIERLHFADACASLWIDGGRPVACGHPESVAAAYRRGAVPPPAASVEVLAAA